jgi:lipopolysaccharide transport system permease protein
MARSLSLTPTLSPSMRKSASLIYHFAERESKARYKRSLLGWFWSFMNPLTTVLVYSFVFGVVYGAKPPPTNNGNAENFGIYLFTGLIVWSLFTGVVNGSMGWLISVSDLRKKIYFPTETALLGGAAANSVQTGLEAVVLLVIMAALANISWTLVFLPVALIFALMFGLGLGFIVSVFNARYRDVQYLVGILLNVAFFTVPIVFTEELLNREEVPDLARTLVLWNPPSLFVSIARDAMYFLEVPQWNHLLAAAAWAIITFSIGWVYFRDQSMAISEEP